MTRGAKALSAAQMFRELARMHVRAQRETIAPFGGSSVRCTILTELGRAESLSVGELASRLRLDKGWISRGVDQLVDDGAVSRVEDRNDRRAVVLTLTAKGQRQHRELDRLLDKQIEDVFATLGAADRVRVSAALRALFAAYSGSIAEAAPERSS